MAKDTTNAVAEANWVAYQRARDNGHDDWLDSAKKCDRFYLGEQWDQRDLDLLEAQGRPALTINEILRVVNGFLGKHATHRADLIHKPRRDANVETAKIITQLSEQILDHNDYESLEKEVFEDGIIIDRGYFDIRLGFEDNVLGDVRIASRDPFEVLPDPDAKNYDPSTWKSVIQTRWMTLDDIEAHYGKKKRNEVDSMAMAYHTFGEDSVRFDGTRTFGYDEFTPQTSNYDDHDKTVRSVRIVERQYKRLANLRYFVDHEMGDTKRIPDDLPDERAQMLAQQMGLGIITRVGTRIRWVVTADNVVLHDDWSPYRTFTLVPYFPFFRRGKTSGVVRQLISPQEQFNKMESQMLHIVNTTANSGWIYEDGSLTNMTTEELEERGAETGLVMAVKRGAQPPMKIESNKIPSGLDRLASRAQANVSGISGIEGLVDVPGREVSGVALDQIEARGLIQVEVPFDALKRTRKMVARKILELIQDFYTETRVLRVTVGDGLATQDEELIINAINAAGEIVNDVTLGEYDVIVGTMPARDNYEDAQFANALQMREAGVMVPDDVVIRHSQLDDKEQIAERVAALQGVAPPTQEEIMLQAQQMQLEIKTAELEAGKLEAEIAELQARAAQQFAKARQLEGEAQLEAMSQALSHKEKLLDLQAKLQMFYDDLKNKLQLASVHSDNKLQTTLMQEQTKHSMKELDVLTKPLPAPTRTQ